MILLILAAGLSGTILAILDRPTAAALVWLVPTAFGAGWLTVHGQVAAPLLLIACWVAVSTLITTPGAYRTRTRRDDDGELWTSLAAHERSSR